MAINPIIYTEFSVWYEAMEQLEHVLADFGAVYEALLRETLFLADKAFRQ